MCSHVTYFINVYVVQHWSSILETCSWPQKRSFHSACSLVDPNLLSSSSHQHHPEAAKKPHTWLPCLTPDLSVVEEMVGLDPKLLVLWGMDNHGDPVNNSWILNVATLAWEQVKELIHCYCNHDDVKVILSGDRPVTNDCVCVCV